MKNKYLLVILLMALAVVAFKSDPQTEKSNLITGTYGDYGDATIQLTINADSTFRYIHKCNPSKPINITGTWVLDGNTIVLKNYNSAISINNKWRIDKNERCLKSRQGLEFIRICLVTP